MKTIPTPFTLVMQLMTLAILLVSGQAYAQPDYKFKNPQKLSGTALRTGAVYLFEDVKTGVDAKLTITSISSGVTLTQLDGGSGYPETLQPTLQIDSWKSGYVEMKIDFLVANTNSPSVQAQIAATCIDVDGVTNYDGHGRNLYEFDQINMGGGYVDFNTVGGELSIAQSGDWFTGTNIAGVDYPGRDTSAKAVMFSVINVNVSSMTVRVGINNQTSNSATRERSVYFKRFVFPNSSLAVSEIEKKRTRKERVYNSEAFKVFPTAIQSSAKIALTAEQDGWASLEIVDYSGRVIMQQQIVVDKGANTIPLFNVSKLSRGSYIAVLRADGMVYSEKLVKQ